MSRTAEKVADRLSSGLGVAEPGAAQAPETRCRKQPERVTKGTEIPPKSVEHTGHGVEGMEEHGSQAATGEGAWNSAQQVLLCCAVLCYAVLWCVVGCLP